MRNPETSACPLNALEPENVAVATFYNAEDTFFMGGKKGGLVEIRPSPLETPAYVLDTTFIKIHVRGEK